MDSRIHKGPNGVPSEITQQSDFNHQDILAAKQLKKYLTPEIVVAILKHKDDLVVMGFSIEFIDSLLDFGVGKSTFVHKKKSPDLSDDNTSREISTSDQGTQHRSTSTDKDTPKNKHYTFPLDLLDRTILTEEEESQLATQCLYLKKDNITVLECKVCAYQSKSSTLMVRHLGCHDNGKCFTCSDCGHTTPFRSKWKRHRCRLSKHARKFSCDQCQESFPTKALFGHHKATQHTEVNKTTATKSFVCDKCAYVGRDLASLEDHQRKHTGDYLKCTKPDCSFKTPYKRSLLKHLRLSHTAEKPLVCLVCGIQTKNSTTLKQHMRHHQKSCTKFECAYCDFASFNTTDVMLHTRRKHYKEKKYHCNKCVFRTGYPLVLKRHLARHDEGGSLAQPRPPKKRKKEYPCSSCDRVFKFKSECKSHERNCNKVLLQADENLIRPKVQKKRKPKEYPCSFCGNIFKSKTACKGHEGRCDKVSIQPETPIPTAVTTDNMEVSNPKLCDIQMFDENSIYTFDNQLETDISEEVYQITSNMLSQGASGENRNCFTAIVDDSLDGSALTEDGYHSRMNDDHPITVCKGRNPMLAETTRTLAAERDDSPLLGESLLSLISDFQRPPPTNRCQSATTPMFASLSPHLVDRPLTPDFFSDTPSNSFFL